MSFPDDRLRQSGFSMVEVLVTLVILMVGLMGLAGLMMHSQRSEMESYQRVQALSLLEDMVSRINANRKAATCYKYTGNTGTPFLGTSSVLAAPTVAASQCTSGAITAVYPSMPAAAATLAAQTAVADLNAWNSALLGAAETLNANNVGAMVGARGCVSYDSTQELINPNTLATIPGSGIYTISIAWQGLGKTFQNTSQLCGSGNYGDELMRRVVSVTLRVASLK